MFIQVFPQTILFQDGFENYTVGTFPSENWVLRYEGTGTENQVVVDDEWVSPDQSLRLECAPNWSSTALRVLSLTSPVVYCEGYIMIKVAGHSGSISFMNPDIGPWGAYYAKVGFFSPFAQGKIVFNEEIELQDCEIKVWYHIKMMYDSQKDLCNVWINGELKGMNLPCPSNGDYTTFCIDAGHPSITSQVWFDDVIVYADLQPPSISSVTDVPNDGGKQVMITWNRSDLDIPDISNPITSYSVWRFDEILTYITSVPAMQLEQYAVIAPTLFDSCSSGCNYTTFQVIAHTADQWVYLVSEPDSGYSVDNSTIPFALSESQVNNGGFQLFPNPADGIVDFRLSIADFQRISLKIFDLFGREVRTWVDEAKSPGEYTVRLDVSNLVPGIYLVRLQAGGQSEVKKLVVQ